MGSKLSATVPVTRLAHRPYACYYAVLGRWRATRVEDLRRTVLVAGSPRSGTTWLGDIVAGLTGWQLLHEPTHVHKLAELRDGHGWDGRPYREPRVDDCDLAVDLERILTGRYLGAGVVKRSRAMDGHLWARHPMVTKAIDVNLLLPWIAQQMPWLRTVHVVRHPLEVVASQEARTESIWSTQTRLPDAYRRLAAAHPEYEAATDHETPAECLLTQWAIEHAWLRDRQADLVGVLPVRYEDLRADLYAQAGRIARFLDLPEPTPEEVAPLARASRAVNQHAATLHARSDLGWRARYDPAELEALRAILARFDHPFYGAETLADRAPPPGEPSA